MKKHTLSYASHSSPISEGNKFSGVGCNFFPSEFWVFDCPFKSLAVSVNDIICK